jgi:TolB-like protein/Tfp pilus assembly protein PilF/tRNA A-37 threonylcarbamoyl transferase component Bud32
VRDPRDQLQADLAERYVLERELGRGGMATVYLAQDLKHDRRVALKVLHAELAAAVGPERFLREIKVTARLDHPHILPVLASGDSAGLLWYTMPYVEGESLRDRLRRESQLSVEEALRIAREIADALGYAHGHGVVHRDIKPENILLAHGHARVADFGVARALETAEGEKLTGTGLAIGTPVYMSPEQASGGQVEGRSDIYSLGCVLYEMLAGEPPFTGPTPQVVIARRFTETPRPLGDTRERLPAGLEPAVAKALARAPADRFETAAEFAQALAQASSAPASEVRRVIRPRASTGQRLLLGAALLIVAAVTYSATRHLAGRGAGGPAPPARPASVAVLPFRNLGPDSREEYMSDGMTEDLINALGRVPELRVVARTSAFTFKGKAEDVRKVGAQLNVGAVVEGSFRKLGDTLRVTAQLVNVADGYQLWSERYERPSAQLLTLEDELARAILRALSPRGTGGLDTSRAARPTDNPEAYKLYLKGRYHLGRLSEEDYRKALGYFDKAIGLDPTFALAYSGLAETYGVLYASFLPPAEGMPKAKAAARRALELDPSLAEAYAALGYVQLEYEWDWHGAEQSFRRAVELKPNYARARLYYGQLLVSLGRFGEAAAQLNLGRQLDPLSLDLEVTAVWPLFYGRRYGEAIDALRKTIATDSNFLGAQFRLAEAYSLKGEFGLAQARLERLRVLMGDHADVLGRLGYFYAVSGQRQKAQAIADSLRARYRKGDADEAYALAMVHTALGEKGRALGWLETAYAERSTWMALIKVAPELDALRGEPGFRALLHKLHFD